MKGLPGTPGGRGLPLRYSRLLDGLVRNAFAGVGIARNGDDTVPGGIAVLALGSFGRREPCLGSDVDLAVIHQGKLPPELEGSIARAVYPLYDARLEVGYSTLTLGEATRLSLSDLRVLTSLLDARFLLGNRGMAALFQEAFLSRISRDREALLGRFLLHEQQRAERFKNEACFVEPDIKEGIGGLRDIHFMEWMLRLFFGCSRLSEVSRYAVFSHFDTHGVARSKAFLLKVRNALHILCRCKEDRVFLAHQGPLAERLGKGASDGGTEVFLRDLYGRLNHIRYSHEEFLDKALEILDPRPARRDLHGVPRDLRVFGEHVLPRDVTLLRRDPLLLLRGIAEAKARGLSLEPSFIWAGRRELLRRRRALRETPGAKALFLDLILLPPLEDKPLRMLLEMGLLEVFIPEFRRIRNLAQYGYYHLRTVDLHSLRTLAVLDEMRRGCHSAKWPILDTLRLEMKDTDALLLAGLLHDIGKGYNGDHEALGAALIPKILGRLGVSTERQERVAGLVRHHSLLARISQRRDLSEERTSVEVAQTLKTRDLLEQVFVLNLADSLATGPMASNDWRMMLMMELFLKVRKIFEEGMLASPGATERIDQRKRAAAALLGEGHDPGAVAALLDQAGSRYFLSVAPEHIARHLSLALTLGDRPFAWSLQRLKEAAVTRIILCIRDRPGLFSRMVGVLGLNNLAVLSASVFTLKNGLAFDIYEVTNPLDPYREEELWARVREEITATLAGEFPLEALVREKVRKARRGEAPHREGKGKVEIRNDISDFFTVLEVACPSRSGLLYEIAGSMHGLGLDIRFARVTADKEKTMGVFYVRDSRGQKIYEEEEIQGIRKGLEEVLRTGGEG